MAEQLISALSGRFDPADYKDQYRERVMDLVRTKQSGGKPKVATFRPKKQKEDDLDDVLAASLAGLGRKKTG
jgi:DNA end-binding protein Ku